MVFLILSEDLLKLLSGFGLLQGILLAILFYFHPKADRTVTTLLAFYIGCISIPILIPVGQQLYTWQIIIFVEPFLVIVGPLLYLYVRSYQERITFRKAWPHFIFFVAFTIYAFVLYNVMGSRYPRSVEVPHEVIRSPYSYVPVLIRFIHRFTYYFLAYRVVVSYQRSIQHIFSETSRINLRWVKYLVHGYLAIVITASVSYTLMINYPAQFSLWVLLIGAVISIHIYLAAWKGVSQPTIWQVQPNMSKEKVEQVIREAEKIEAERHSNGKVKPRKAGLSDERINETVNQIRRIMKEEKLYSEPELTLQQSGAERLNISLPIRYPRGSNEGMDKTFYDLINGYRVEEAKRLLLEPESKNFTILSVGFEAGFNSKTTFNTVFKKFTGQTPTDYRAKHKMAAALA